MSWVGDDGLGDSFNLGRALWEVAGLVSNSYVNRRVGIPGNGEYQASIERAY